MNQASKSAGCFFRQEMCWGLIFQRVNVCPHWSTNQIAWLSAKRWCWHHIFQRVKLRPNINKWRTDNAIGVSTEIRGPVLSIIGEQAADGVYILVLLPFWYHIWISWQIVELRTGPQVSVWAQNSYLLIYWQKKFKDEARPVTKEW